MYYLTLWIYISETLNCNLLEFYVVIIGIKMDSFDFIKSLSSYQKRFWPIVAITSSVTNSWQRINFACIREHLTSTFNSIYLVWFWVLSFGNGEHDKQCNRKRWRIHWSSMNLALKHYSSLRRMYYWNINCAFHSSMNWIHFLSVNWTCYSRMLYILYTCVWVCAWM